MGFPSSYDTSFLRKQESRGLGNYSAFAEKRVWIPACAGMTKKGATMKQQDFEIGCIYFFASHDSRFSLGFFWH
jgi:hypothetical protein